MQKMSKTIGFLLKLSRRDTTIVNCQLSIVNSAKPLNSQFVSLPWKAGTRKKRLPMLLGRMGNREEGR